jgi:Flp pilus assembly protein TadG
MQAAGEKEGVRSPVSILPAIRGRTRARGQSLVEFALVFPVVIALLAAIIQFGVVFWAQNTLTQVVRDTGRWAATHPCVPASVVSKEAEIASNGTYALVGTLNSISVVYWDNTDGTHPQPPTISSPPTPCPPADNTIVANVSVTVTQDVPTFFPGMEYLPLLGTCNPKCHVSVSSTAQFRLEPHP